MQEEQCVKNKISGMNDTKFNEKGENIDKKGKKISFD